MRFLGSLASALGWIFVVGTCPGAGSVSFRFSDGCGEAYGGEIENNA
jgi:hypothetical protein